jgi:spore coat polysaccharide biosynthesis predicted glycosyltransferase SpsG
VIDDVSDRRLAANDVFYPPVPQVRSLNWQGFTGRVHTGWEWVLLRPDFASDPHREPHDPPVVLVTMGGSDPAGLTLKAFRALALIPEAMECLVLLGRGFAHELELSRLLPAFPHRFRIVRAGDVRAQMLAADLAVLSFGVTAYEAAACALPAIHLCLTDDHALSSAAFAQAGLALSLGVADDVQEAQVAQVVQSMLADHAARNAMGSLARNLVDGDGLTRIAKVVATRRTQ